MGTGRLIQQGAEKGHALAAAEVVAIRGQGGVVQNCSITAQNDFGARRVLAHQRDRFLHAMEENQVEGNANVVRALLQFADQFAMRRVLQHHGWRIEVGGNVIQPIGEISGARAEDALGAGDLSVENFVSDAGSVPMSGADWAANTCQQNFGSDAKGRPRAFRSLALIHERARCRP